MRNLFAFIWRNYEYFLFAILEVFCFILLFQNNNFHKAAYVSSANRVSGKIYQTKTDVSQYFRLKNANEQLTQENAMLHNLMKESYMDLKVIDSLINDSLLKQKYHYTTAKIINNTVNRRNNYLTIDRGKLQGIKPETAVICSNGIVGIVKDVSDNFASVISLLHKDARISVKIKHTNFFGSLVWEGGDHRFATLNDIPVNVKLAKGDTIETNAYSTLFPEGVLAGVVDSYDVGSGRNFYVIKVKLSTDFKNISYVYVIDNLMKEEQRKLEETSQTEKQE
jgi:rod shape-determining protein MreC